MVHQRSEHRFTFSTANCTALNIITARFSDKTTTPLLNLTHSWADKLVKWYSPTTDGPIKKSHRTKINEGGWAPERSRIWRPPQQIAEKLAEMKRARERATEEREDPQHIAPPDNLNHPAIQPEDTDNQDATAAKIWSPGATAQEPPTTIAWTDQSNQHHRIIRKIQPEPQKERRYIKETEKLEIATEQLLRGVREECQASRDMATNMAKDMANKQNMIQTQPSPRTLNKAKTDDKEEEEFQQHIREFWTEEIVNHEEKRKGTKNRSRMIWPTNNTGRFRTSESTTYVIYSSFCHRIQGEPALPVVQIEQRSPWGQTNKVLLTFNECSTLSFYLDVFIRRHISWSRRSSGRFWWISSTPWAVPSHGRSLVLHGFETYAGISIVPTLQNETWGIRIESTLSTRARHDEEQQIKVQTAVTLDMRYAEVFRGCLMDTLFNLEDVQITSPRSEELQRKIENGYKERGVQFSF